MPTPGSTTVRTHEYELGHTDWELKRLANQALVMDPITRRHFQDAGIEPGMRVLDVGSGAGDVAFLAAELVTSSGEVVGTDRSPTAVAAAQARAQQRGFPDIRQALRCRRWAVCADVFAGPGRHAEGTCAPSAARRRNSVPRSEPGWRQVVSARSDL